jgi:putative membrane protein
MLAVLAGHLAYAPPGWGDGQGAWDGGGPGWWLAFPITFWVLVLAAAGYLIYRRSPGQSARRAAEHTLAQRYASGEISEEELRQRRAGLRGRS